MNKKRKLIINANEISQIKSLNLNGYEQKVLIEGKHRELPIVICLHGGPGSPIPFSVGCRGMFPEFTDKFIMVYWDQLGCGINDCIIDDTFTIDKFVGMTVSLIKQIKAMFPTNKLLLFAVSWGSILSANAVSMIPQLIDGVIVYGQVLKSVAFNEETFTTLEVSSINSKAKKKIADLKNKNQYIKKDLMTMSGLIRKYTDGYQNKSDKSAPVGKIVMGLLTSPDYKFRDFIAIFKNGYANNESILQELLGIDLSQVLTSIKKQYFIIQGDTDIVTSSKAIIKFVDTTQNDNLHCEIIKNSGHLPSENAVNVIMQKLVSLSTQ